MFPVIALQRTCIARGSHVGSANGRHANCRRHGSWTMPLAGLLCMASMGCATMSEASRRQIVGANQQYQKGQYDAASRALEPVIKDHPRLPETAEAYYIRALCHLQARRTAGAVKDLNECLKLSQRPDLTARAHATLGGLAFDSGRFDEANGHFEAALKSLPEEPPADELHYRHGIALQRAGRWDESQKQFAKLFQYFPNSRFEEDTRRRFGWKENAFSIQCGAFSRSASADQFLSTLKAKGLDSRRDTESRGGQPMYVVYVGRYPEYSLAQSALAAVRRHVPDALIVP